MGKSIALAAALLLFSVSQVAVACTCAPPGTPREEAAKSVNVFVGTVTSVRVIEPPTPKQMGALRSFVEDIRSVLTGRKGLPKPKTFQPYTLVTLSVSETLKGKPASVRRVRASHPSFTCGPHFRVGKEYVVYTHDNQGFLAASGCSRTTLSSDPRGGLYELRHGI